MKQSTRIVLRLMPIISAAALAAGCGSRRDAPEAGWQTCVDSIGRVADEQACVDERRTSHGVGYVPMYLWYYYPFGGRTYPVGYGVPLGGSYSAEPFRGIPTRSIGAPTTGASAPRAGSVTRGGFGGTASGAAGE